MSQDISNRNAGRVFFGLAFQVNAAILLMLRYISDLKGIRLEGKREDIEITLSDDKKVYAQAKSIVAANNDFRSVQRNLYKALITLSEAAKYDKKNDSIYIYVTNSPNPLKEEKLMRVISGETLLPFDSLPIESQKKLLEATARPKSQVPLDRFSIYYFPYVSDEKKEREKIVRNEVEKFVNKISEYAKAGMGEELLNRWQRELFDSAMIYNKGVDVSKKDMIWPLITILTQYFPDSDMYDDIEADILDEIEQIYSEALNQCAERWEFITQVLYDYNTFIYNGARKKKYMAFAQQKWPDYVEQFKTIVKDDEVCESFTKVLLMCVLRRRRAITSIKQKLNL